MWESQIDYNFNGYIIKSLHSKSQCGNSTFDIIPYPKELTILKSPLNLSNQIIWVQS